LLLRGARLLLGDGKVIERGHVVLSAGRIAAVGSGDGRAPAGTRVIDVAGKTITPGLIDTHSHLGVYPSPAVEAHRDGNEMSAPVTAGARAIDAFWVQDPDIERAVQGGVSVIQVLPGSGNLIGGRAVTLKLRPAASAGAMQFRGAPGGLKMACGENPKRVYGERKQEPMTRMGNLAAQREAFLAARRLIEEWDTWRLMERQRLRKDQKARVKYLKARRLAEARRDGCRRRVHAATDCATWEKQWRDKPLEPPDVTEPRIPPKRDLDLEALAAALEGRLLVHVHCYRSDDMTRMLALADEVGFRIRSFHHALEAYKIRRTLAERSISVSTWADWWGFKLEAYDGIPENLALIANAGGRAIVHSDSREGIRRLNQEASKGMWSGRHAGLAIDEGEAIRWITLNPAWALGIDDRVGSLTVGKDADIVVWDKNPFSVYAKPLLVLVDGIVRFDAQKPALPRSDFEARP
jgi:imidazolonepropionase-like amidohydrolase